MGICGFVLPRDGGLATLAGIMMTNPDHRLDFPASGRNADAILGVLDRVLPAHGWVLEVGAGSGQHAIHFQRGLPRLTWLASDPDPRHRESIAAWTAHEGLDMAPPVDVDARALKGWALPVDATPVTAVVSINMIHIAPWDCCTGLLANAARHLGAGGVLYLYGPFKVGGQHTAPSNAAFDQSLRAEDPAWGVRNLDDVALEARRLGFQLAETVAMPANNFSVVFNRTV